MACRERIVTIVSVMLSGMAKRNGAMHVAKVSKKYVTKDGVSRESVAYLLRRTYRDGLSVKHETLANLSALPQETLEAVRVSLTGQMLVVPGQDLEVTGSRPHGHVAAVHAQAKALGLEAGHHHPVVGQHHAGRVPGRGRRHHRRGLRGDGLACRTPGRHRVQAGPHPPERAR